MRDEQDCLLRRGLNIQVAELHKRGGLKTSYCGMEWWGVGREGVKGVASPPPFYVVVLPLLCRC